MKNLEDLNIAICQMPVSPGQPDKNTAYIIDEIKKARIRKADIVIFPEMAVPGYLIGDLYEDKYFINDIEKYNQKIVENSQGITVIFGSLACANTKKGEDGRSRKFNAAIVAKNGKLIGISTKTLQPNYRIFDDDRYFYSLRKVIDENRGENSDTDLKDHLMPFEIKTINKNIKIGVILCEDMWHDDYIHNPTKILVENGAEIIFNLSASPWTWQKNRKRHNVVKNILTECKVPFVYVNNTGVQNTGKNIVIFDGSSTVYNNFGNIVFEVEPYFTGTKDYIFDSNPKEIRHREKEDTEELYLALIMAIKGSLETLPQEMRKVVIGLSGGIDSALTAALYTDVLGPENVLAINMPSKYNSQKTKDIAANIAKNLGIKLLVIPIQEIVENIGKATDCREGEIAYENIQARTRMEILAATAQKNNCVFSANWNKVEAAFGYGTLYGDMAGFIAVIGDLVKYEIYQVADYLNREIFKKEVIPKECFSQAPTAELKNNQSDPFDYGRLGKRGYHDEMVRSFTEFRLNPEWFLEKYLEGTLEKELRLKNGTLKRLFATDKEFADDLEKNWKRFANSYFKRVQGSPIPIVSRRAFGTDLRESILPPYFTQEYQRLRKSLLKNFTANQL